MTRTLLSLAGACAISACTGGGPALVHSEIIDTAYMPNEVAVGAAMPLELRGAPPGGGTAAEVAASMRLPPSFGGQPLDPVGAPTQGPRIVVAFAPSGRRGVCAPDGVPGGRNEARLQALVAYCHGAKELSSAIVEGPAAGPGDPAFASAMSQALQTILPPRNPAFDEGDAEFL